MKTPPPPFKSELPELPKKIKKVEAACTPRILKWFQKYHKNSAAIEIKATMGHSIPKSALLPHQEAALRAAQASTGIVHKISDAGHLRTPFDAFKLAHVDAYVVAAFPKEGIAYVFDINDWRGAAYPMANPPPRYRISLTNKTGLL